MKSGFAGSPTNPIFHFHLTFHFRQVFFEKDQRSSRCWSSLVVYEYIRACERNRLRQNTHVVNAHSCLLTTYSISYRWFFAPQFQTHTFPSQIFPLITDFINSQHYLVSCANFYFSYFHNSLRKKKQQQQQQTNKRKIKTKRLPLKMPKQTAIFIYYFSLLFPSYILGFQPNVNCLLFLYILLFNARYIIFKKKLIKFKCTKEY